MGRLYLFKILFFFVHEKYTISRKKEMKISDIQLSGSFCLYGALSHPGLDSIKL